LKKYNPVQLYHYDTKEVSVIEIKSYPKVIYFCNNPIGEKDIASANNWKNLNPDYEIKLYDDEMIRSFLLQEYGELHRSIFDYLKDGPIRADFWRVCILYKYGGVYSDIDNLPLVPLCNFIEPDVDFVTCSSYINQNFNPNFIIAYKDSIILKRCIDWYVNKYTRKDPYEYHNWSIMDTFTQTLHLENYNKNWGTYKCGSMVVQIINERPGRHHYDAHNVYKNMRVFNNRQPGWNYNLHRFN
jgi:mannosyltransferase OCH1-like enzyme